MIYISKIESEKTIKELTEQYPNATVYTVKDFSEMAEEGDIMDDDGTGFFHNGFRGGENVFEYGDYNKDAERNQKFVIWYNK